MPLARKKNGQDKPKSGNMWAIHEQKGLASVAEKIREVYVDRLS
jgi:hypothetical protein